MNVIILIRKEHNDQCSYGPGNIVTINCCCELENAVTILLLGDGTL